MQSSLLLRILQFFSFSLFLVFVKCWSPGKHKSSIQKYGKSFPENCTHEFVNVDVYILSAGDLSAEGLVKLMVISFSHDLYTVCYPKNDYSNRQVATFSHVVCRQLGYMTYAIVYQHKFPAGMEPKSVQAHVYCNGGEQSLDHCSWCGLTHDRCNTVLAVHCSSCYSTLEASEGFIANPGYPHAYLYTVRCQWVIKVPEDNTILLTFRQFSLPISQSESVNCEFGQPHVEIIYGSQNALSVHRYCTFNYIKTTQVPHRKVKVRFYSGIYSGITTDSEKDYGFNLHFQAQPVLSSSFQSYKVIVVLGTFAAFFVMLMVCYCCRKWGPKFRRRNRTSGHVASAANADTRHPQRTVAFHQIPGDVVGMKIAEENVFHPSREARKNSLGVGPENGDFDSSECQPNLGEVYIRGVESQLSPSAPACCGTPHIPRNEIPLNQNREGLISKLKTTLFSRFSSESARSSFRSSGNAKHVATEPIAIPQVSNFRIYTSFESSSDSAAASGECPNIRGDHRTDPRSSSSSTHDSETPVTDKELSAQSAITYTIPKIVVECVDDDTPELYECPKFNEENQYLRLSP